MWLCITTNWLHEDKLVIQGCRGNWFDKSSTCWTLHSCLPFVQCFAIQLDTYSTSL